MSDNEALYFRWYNDHFEKNGKLRPANIIIPDQSMNRKSFDCRFWHVLVPEPNDDAEKARKTLCRGIVWTQVSRFTLETVQKGIRFEFRVEHDPLNHNYGHCELRTYQGGTRLTFADANLLRKDDKKPWTAAKKWFRTEVAKHRDNEEIRVLLNPEVGTKGSQ